MIAFAMEFFDHVIKNGLIFPSLFFVDLEYPVVNGLFVGFQSGFEHTLYTPADRQLFQAEKIHQRIVQVEYNGFDHDEI